MLETSAPAAEPVNAVVCVEIVRACGLLAAIQEASTWLGGGMIPAMPHRNIRIGFPLAGLLPTMVPIPKQLFILYCRVS